MAIKNVQVNNIGMTDIHPSIAYIETDSTLAEVQATGFLNKIAGQFKLREDMMALVSTKTTPNAQNTQVAWMEISKSGDVWSLVPSETTLPLSDGQIFVGNSSGVATDVAMSGDVAIANTGATTIQAGAIDLAMLSSGITPSHVIKYAGKENNGGGSATIAITQAGVLTSDLVFAQLEASTNAVTVQKVTPTANTVTVLLSGDPGAATVVTWQVLRAAS